MEEKEGKYYIHQAIAKKKKLSQENDFKKELCT